MIKKEYKNLETFVYSKVLKNGLEIFVIPENKKEVTVEFLSIFGSGVGEFVPLGESKYFKPPYGAAHFLEHQLFESGDSEDIMTFFEKNSLNLNAYTTKHYTSYHFSGKENIYLGISKLLDFVQNPNFCEKTVEKEKGIILSEIERRNDYPITCLTDEIYFNLFKKSAFKYPVIGTKESVLNTTYDDLRKCYETFYHPCNMKLIISGNIDAEEVIKEVEKNQSDKTFKEFKKIHIKKEEEPFEVAVKNSYIKKNIAKPFAAISFKLANNLNGKSLANFKYKMALIFLITAKFGDTSLYFEEAKEKGLLTTEINFSFSSAINYFLLDIYFKSYDYTEIFEHIKSDIKKTFLSKEDFDREKKVFKSIYVYSSSIHGGMSDFLIGDLILKQEPLYNIYDELENFSYKECIDILKTVDFSNYTEVVLKQ